jgi:putative membrane protein
MSLLGALLTFAPHPLFAPHALTTEPWGLTPLADQQLGGAIMWGPGGLLFLAAALWVVASSLTGLAHESSRAHP